MDEYLQRALERALADFPGKYSLYCVELDTMTPAAAIAPQTRVVSASTIKVAIMFCALEEVNQGRLTLDRPVPLTQEDFCGDTRVFDSVLDDRGQRQLRHQRPDHPAGL